MYGHCLACFWSTLDHNKHRWPWSWLVANLWHLTFSCTKPYLTMAVWWSTVVHSVTKRYTQLEVSPHHRFDYCHCQCLRMFPIWANRFTRHRRHNEWLCMKGGDMCRWDEKQTFTVHCQRHFPLWWHTPTLGWNLRKFNLIMLGMPPLLPSSTLTCQTRGGQSKKEKVVHYAQ